jgi:hypothetical protein
VADVGAVADRLYGLPLEEFTKARDAEAKQARADGDRAAADEVKALRKPSKATWAINQVVRSQPDDVDALLAAGDAVRDALARGQDVRPSSRTLSESVERLADATVAQAGEPARDDAVTTFRAAAAEPELGQQLRAGRLVAPLASTGFAAAGLSVMPREHGHEDDTAAREHADRERKLERLAAEVQRAE